MCVCVCHDLYSESLLFHLRLHMKCLHLYMFTCVVTTELLHIMLRVTVGTMEHVMQVVNYNVLLTTQEQRAGDFIKVVYFYLLGL